MNRGNHGEKLKQKRSLEIREAERRAPPKSITYIEPMGKIRIGV
jgi:hypothetical protein